MNWQKDKRGKDLIKLLCIPDHYGNFCTDSGLLKEMYQYCLQDVVAERFAADITPPLTEQEQHDWVVSEKVNDAGLRIDRSLAIAATNYAEDEVEEISQKINKITNGEITSPRQFKRIKEYLRPLIEDDVLVQKAVLRVETDRRSGEEKRRITCDSDARLKLLALEKEHPGRLPEDIVALIELLDEAGRSSVHKYRNMDQRAGTGDRVRGAYMFSGAGQTGRFSSLGLQVHNFPRKKPQKPDVVRKTILGGKPLDDGVMDTLSSMLRYAVMAAEGHSFVCGDWSQIEARVLPWLSGGFYSVEGMDFLGGSPSGSRMILDTFYRNDRDPDAPDIYMLVAAWMFETEPEKVTEEQRQVGKVAVLALGYQGGLRAFQSMARSYSLKIDDDSANSIIRQWRYRNTWAPRFWKDSQRAATQAAQTPGEYVTAGRLKYCQPSENKPLYCELPSGRILSYPDPQLEAEEGPYGTEYKLSAIKAQWKPKRGETDWGRINLYGGLLAENATQATAADILRHAMQLTIEDEWPLVGTTHDELLLEVRDDEIVDATGALEAIMLDKPAWAKGLPLACKIWNGKRYRK